MVAVARPATEMRKKPAGGELGGAVGGELGGGGRRGRARWGRWGQ